MISELQKKIIINTIMPFHPMRIGIFGSVARGDNSENSDIEKIEYLARMLHTKRNAKILEDYNAT